VSPRATGLGYTGHPPSSARGQGAWPVPDGYRTLYRALSTVACRGCRLQAGRCSRPTSKEVYGYATRVGVRLCAALGRGCARFRVRFLLRSSRQSASIRGRDRARVQLGWWAFGCGGMSFNIKYIQIDRFRFFCLTGSAFYLKYVRPRTRRLLQDS
jgi:hypothetical protein